MKKSIVISVVSVVSVAVVASLMLTGRVDSKWAKGHVANAESEFSDKNDASSAGSNQETVMTGDIEQLEQIIRDVPAIEEFDREYRNYKLAELEKAMEDSKRAVADGNLIEKANQGILARQEIQILVTEIRRQGVLSHYLVKDQVEQMKRKYL